MWVVVRLIVVVRVGYLWYWCSTVVVVRDVRVVLEKILNADVSFYTVIFYFSHIRIMFTSCIDYYRVEFKKT